MSVNARAPPSEILNLALALALNPAVFFGAGARAGARLRAKKRRPLSCNETVGLILLL
jgi:hypothetical protein